jgi:hypothetical protein
LACAAQSPSGRTSLGGVCVWIFWLYVCSIWCAGRGRRGGSRRMGGSGRALEWYSRENLKE